MQTSMSKGILTLAKLIYMGFDVNVIDENGETAISHFFKTSLQSRWLAETVDLFLNLGSQTFNVDLLMKDLGKHFSLYGRKGFGPCFLLQIVKQIKNTRTIPRSDSINFENLLHFIGKLRNYTSSECRGNNGCLICTSIRERLREFQSDI